MRVPTAVLAALTALALSAAAMAAGSSSSSSSSNSSSSSSSSSSRSSSPSPSPSSSGGFSRPSAPSAPSSSGGFSGGGSKPAAPAVAAPAAVPHVAGPPPASAAPSSSGGFSAGQAKPQTSVPSVPATAPAASAYDTHVNREMSSKAFEARQTPAFKAAVGEKTYTPQQVQQTRSTYYTTVYRDRYIPAPVGTSYGSFSEQFMWAMMFNAAFAHNRSDDPAYRQWRRDAEERAATDQKVKDQLADLDRKVSAIAATPKDPNYVPSDVPPEVIFTESALTTKPETGHSIWFSMAMMMAAGGCAFVVFRFFASKRRFA